MGTLFIKVIEISIVASFLMLAVIIFRLPLKKAPKWFMGVLWAIVALRLLFPFQIESKVGSFVAVHFSDADYDVSIDMVQPWGEDGIYVPVKYILPKEVKSEEY